MKAIWIERLSGRRTKPGFIIDASRRAAIGRFANRRKPVEISPAAYETDLAKFSGADQFGCLKNVLATAPLRAHLHDALVPAARFDPCPAFVHRFGERFFDINILTGLASHHRWQGVPMIGCCHQNNIDILSIENSPKVFSSVRLFVALLFTNFDTLRVSGVIDITNRHTIDLWIQKKTFQIALPHSTAADQPKPDFFAWRRFTRAR